LEDAVRSTNIENSAGGAVEPAREIRLLGLLVLICGLLIAAGLAMPSLTGAKASAPSPMVLGDVSEAHIVEIRDLGGRTVLSGEFRSAVDRLGNTEKDAALSDGGGRLVIGEVEVEIPAAGRENRRPELEVDIIGLPPRETFTVVIDDRIVGRFTTDDRGSVDMELQEGEIPPGLSEKRGAFMPRSSSIQYPADTANRHEEVS
jgi:hypothetical protein